MQAHATMLAIAVWLSRPRGLAYAAAFLIALGARLSLWSPVAGVAALVAAIVTAHVGLNQSWSRFPWVETSDWLAFWSLFSVRSTRDDQHAGKDAVGSTARVLDSRVTRPGSTGRRARDFVVHSVLRRDGRACQQTGDNR